MVQPMLPKGLHRMRYDGLHATCKAKKVKEMLTGLMVALGRLMGLLPPVCEILL
jgi:hypothetical protein